jgi:hypothetical protein
MSGEVRESATAVVPQGGEILSTERVDNVGFESLGGEVAPSEAELMGGGEGATLSAEAQPGTDKPAPDASAGGGTEGEKPEEKAPDPEPKPEDKPEEKPAEKPPKGFVPKGALTEERRRRQELQALNEDLRKQVTELKHTDAGRAPFTLLTREDEDALADEDPTTFNKYLRDKTEYLENQKHESALKQSNERIVQDSMERMVSAVPKVHDPAFNRELTTFAMEHGMDDKTLAALTDPRTQFMPPWTQTPVLLGHGAVNLIEMIHNFHSKSKAAPDEETIRESVRKELEPKIREEVTKELMSKIRDGGKRPFVSVGEIPGAGDKEISKSLLSEQEFSKLSAEDQRKALGG